MIDSDKSLRPDESPVFHLRRGRRVKKRAQSGNPLILRMRLAILLILTVTSSFAFSQKKNSSFQYHIRKTSSPIQIDGSMDAAWLSADSARDFFMVLPMDTSKAQVPTTVRMLFDQQNLYMIVTCYQFRPAPFMVESLRRDFAFGRNDNFIFFLDPFDNRTNGFTFGANAAGAQWDGALYDGGANDASWDGKWTSVVKNYPFGYIFEAAIPFKTIRYKKGVPTWGVNFSRLDITMREKSSWAPVPRQFPTASLAYTGDLVWDEPPPNPGLNISLIPYALASVSKNYETKQSNSKVEFGGDAKIGLTSSMNLDLTINPDFSQVEVDRQVTNLDRYELFFPERRQFFLENADLFANFGYASIRPFFSRRIGLGVPIHFGTKLSGSLNKNWRIGMMDMQTGKVEETGLPAQNFAVVALQRRVFSRSNLRVMFVNKQALNYADSSKGNYSEYNRNIGLEYNLASANNLWTGKVMFVKSYTPGVKDDNAVHAANIQYSSKKWIISWQHEIVGKNYNAEVGYVPRKDYVRFGPQIGYNFFPKSGKILSHGPRLVSFYFFDKKMRRTDNEEVLLYLFNLRDQSIFDVWTGHDYLELLVPFDPTNSGKDTLARGSIHKWRAFGVEYFSRPQQLFTYSITTRFGGYYQNGTRINVTSDLGYRFQPYVSISLSTSFNYIELPKPWGSTNLWLVGPRIDFTFTNKLYFTTFLQYNNQLKNVNLNTRLQWRYKPASDIFLVYTDNYFPGPFSVRNRAVVLKVNYWGNF